MSEKAEKMEQKHREEHQRLVEMYEGSGRYKDVRELYENKLQAKEQELMSAKESLLQINMKLEQKEKDAAKLTSDNEAKAIKILEIQHNLE